MRDILEESSACEDPDTTFVEHLPTVEVVVVVVAAAAVVAVGKHSIVLDVERKQPLKAPDNIMSHCRYFTRILFTFLRSSIVSTCIAIIASMRRIRIHLESWTTSDRTIRCCHSTRTSVVRISTIRRIGHQRLRLQH
jgi:hypothetical protein